MNKTCINLTSNKVEQYWSKVAENLSQRTIEEELIAGDNDLFYTYKRKVFLSKLAEVVDWQSKVVLEFGCGPGGNLKFLSHLGVRSLIGVDISSAMLELARKNLWGGEEVKSDLIHNNGEKIPVEDNSSDVVFTSTVLQHNVEDEIVNKIIGEMCRVSSDVVILCEHTERKRKKLHDHFVGRTLEYYQDQVCRHGYAFESVEYLDIQVSYYLLGAIRKLFNPGSRKEGEPLNPLSLNLQKAVFGITRFLDRWLPAKRDHTLMVFSKKSTKWKHSD